MDATTIKFADFLQTAFDQGNYATDDVIAFITPLIEEIIGFHEAGLVAPFDQPTTLFVSNQRLDIDENFAHRPTSATAALKQLFVGITSKNFDITGAAKLETEVAIGESNWEDLQIHLSDEKPAIPVYVKGYRCFEMLVGHHDAQTDIFCIGLILGSMALALDLQDADDLKLFVRYRTNPVQYNQRIHPTISALITEMTELDRHKRTQDLYEVLHRLKNYRDYDPEKQTDLSSIPGWVNKALTERHQLILNKLRNRLFDTSRRNRLLYYKPNARFVNLTVSSVPTVLHYQSIRPELLFTWNEELAPKITAAKELILNKYLRFEDHPYLPSSLDKIRVESQRDVQEFGFSQLKLVIAFLNWHNLKEVADERIQSPLLLIPVELKRNKRLKEDHYHLKVLDSIAEVNPVLANQLRELYGIQLPDFIDLEELSPEQFYQSLKNQIDQAHQGIQLHYINKPRIKLIHSVAKQTVGNYKRRMNQQGGRLNSYKQLNYSYESAHYQPLGLEIFKQRIQSKPSVLEFLVNEDIQHTQHLTGTEGKERALYELTDSESNPYSWDVDMCNMVLGNFNYKKMSLVRDYNQVIDQQLQHEVFESLFSHQPKKLDQHTWAINNPDEWHHVITADPTQTNAILQSRTGESYIIQGPPGTGKSQTITNLIADFVARGKKVLFVCEKRAALDVVYHRLKQNGLDELCCYIHDSQGDKRTFIKNLKDTYEDFSKNRMDLSGIRFQRNKLLQQLQTQLQLLEQFHQTHLQTPDDAGVEVRALIQRLIALKDHQVTLSPQAQELLPGYAHWLNFGETIQQLCQQLEETGAEAAIAQHPLSKLSDTIFNAENPLNLTDSLLQTAQQVLSEIQQVLSGLQVPAQHAQFLHQIKSLIQDAVLLQPLAEHDNLKLAVTGNTASKEFDKKIRQYKKLQQQTAQQQAANQNWLQKFSANDTAAALEIARKHENSFFKFLNGSWRKLKQQIQSSYDFSKHQIKPAITTLLEQLQNEYTTTLELNQHQQNLLEQYRLTNIDITCMGIEHIRAQQGDPELTYLLSHPDANQLVLRLYRLNNQLHQLELQLQQCLYEFQQKPVSQIADELQTLSLNTDALADLLPAFKQFAQLPEKLKNSLRHISLTPVQAEAAMAQKSMAQLLLQQKQFAHTDLRGIEQAAQQIQQLYEQLLQLNAALIRATIREQFLHHIEISNTAISQLNADQKAFKKNYNEGRKIVENEFGKSMRYKSIRELNAKESSLVLKDIKPVWLMSPLSVSDSLPLDSGFFDVVIFDEASQITLEEGIPALYRAVQTIIVGDDKQMPPTNFFTAKAEDPDDLQGQLTEADEELLSTDADSLLVQGSRKLNSTMLSWHYRSHFETLISYSNHAFYGANLLTIPDKTIHHNEKAAIEAQTPEEAAQYIDCLFDRSISYHYLGNSVYEKRNNAQEAAYIAQMVRCLLQRNSGDSIGIVAFSQEQQQTIEDALSALAETDKVFEQQLEEVYNRTENDQFVGLIIKNLENIQGDERDIIIMSVCYGFDSRKKMIMNFGPINKKGGEKRLNVIFSRAKKHMAIVSSIKHHHISNEYNEGANYFKRFLHYAESVSAGNMQAARTILDGLVVTKSAEGIYNTHHAAIAGIRDQLQQRGYEVAVQVGQSGFKCSLAVKQNPGDTQYALGILLDDDMHYGNPNLLEQYFQRPAVLRAFGWRMIQVFAKDWLYQPEKVIDLILKKMQEGATAETTATTDWAATFLQPQPQAEAQPDQPKENPILPGFEQVRLERFQCIEGNSNKFWEVGLQDTKMIVRYGKTGTKGQVNIKTFDTDQKAIEEKNKLIKEKLAKGYLRV